MPVRWAPRISQGGAVEALESASKDVRRWRIRLPSGPAFELSLADATAEAPKSDVTTRQSSAYRLWPYGMDLQVDLSLDVAGGPLSTLDVDLTPGLVLLAANTAADQPISWSQVGSPEAPRARLHLPQPLSGQKHAIRLEATAPLRLDKTMVLPAVRPRDAFWQEGVATVWLEGSLSLEGFSVRDGRQSAGLAPQGFGRFSGTGLSVRLLGPEASIEAAVGHSRPRLEVSHATTIALGSNELRGRTSADVICLDGECFELWVEMGMLWSVETVETTPRDALAGWEERTTDPPSASLVRVRLSNPLKAGKSLRLTLTGRNASSRVTAQPTVLRWNELSHELFMLTFRDARAVERLWSVEPAPGGTVRLGDSVGVRELAAADLAAGQRRLFDRTPRGLVLAVDVRTPQVEVVAQRSRASLRAALHVEAFVAADHLREDYRLECTPDGASLGEVEVRFSQPCASPLEWSLLAGDTERQLAAIPVTPSEGQAWRVRLPYALSEPFVLRAVRHTPLSDRLAISLPMVPQADHQEGTLAIFAEPDARFLIDNHSLEAVEGTDDDEATSAALCGRWRFKPDRDAASNQAAVTVLRDARAPAAAGAVVRRVRLDSHYATSGGARHRAAFQIENYALSAAQLLLPSDARQVEVRIDGIVVPVEQEAVEQDAEARTIRLNPGQRQIQVDYDTPFGGLGLLTTVTPDMPRWQAAGADLPVLESAWRIISPPGYEVLALAPWQSSAPGRATWLRRLLGPLASTRDAQPLDRDQALALLEPEDGLSADERSHTLMGTAEGRPTARIVHYRTFEAAGWALFLGVSLGVYCFGPWSRRPIALVAAGLVAFALLVPGYCVPLGLGALWGLAVGLVLAVLWPAGRPSTTADVGEPRDGGSSLARAGAVSVMGLALIVGHTGRANEASPDASLPVIIPVTADPHVEAGQVVHVPETMWERWRQRRLENARAQPWMIERADYVGRVSGPSASGPVPPPSLTATLGLRTAENRTRVRVDFGAPLGPFRPLDALLDGQLIELAWDEAGRVCALDVPKAGAHALDLELRPHVRADGMSWQLEQPVPPLAGASVSLAFPAADMASAELVSAVGSVTRSSRALLGQLGPADRIVVRWQNGAAAAGPPRAEVDELLWLRLKTGAVSLRARWALDVHRGLVRQFHLAADRRLRLNGDFRDGDGQMVRHEGEPAAPRTAVGPQVFKLTLDPPRSGRFVVECEFLLEDTHGIGQLRYPHLTITDLPIGKRRLAVSWDAELKVDELSPPGKPRASVAEFLAAWGDDDGKPQAVRDGREGKADWSLAVRPRPLSRAVQQTLWADFGPRRAEVRFEADVTGAAAPCFHHALRLPDDLVVEQLTVSEGDQMREAAWTTEAGVLNVFLRDKAAPMQRLVLVGFVPIAAPGTVRVPAIHFDREQALTTSAETRIYRQPTVQVTLQPSRADKKPRAGAVATPEFAPAEPDAATSSGGVGAYPSGRLVSALPTPPGTELRINLQPSRPRVRSAVLITRLRQEADQWLADIAYDLLVTGELDGVTFVSPSDLGEPAIVEPPGRLERQPGGARTAWRYVPSAPLRGAARVLLSWRLPAATPQRVEIPEINVATTTPAERLVAVPSTAEDWAPRDWRASAPWTRSWLPSVPRSPRTALRRNDGPDCGNRWLISISIGPRPRPCPRPRPRERERPPCCVAPPPSKARCRTTEAAVDWRLSTDTAYHGVARFTLATEGPESVKIHLPDGCHLVRCAWAARSAIAKSPGLELPLAASRTDDECWRVRLGPQSVPRTLEVMFAGELATSVAGGQARLQAPALVDLPIDGMSWAVRLPPGRSASPPEGAETSIAEGRQVISLAVDGPESHVLTLAVHAADRDSLGRRVFALATLLGGSGALVWAIVRLQRRRREASAEQPMDGDARAQSLRQ